MWQWQWSRDVCARLQLKDHAALSNPLIVVAAFLEAGAADESWSC
jgi:hypothetical protein